ncbi:MAG: hypothetical protein KBA95_15845, partial [Acidobacteria bacterium]|nr:hypothetical protein [Acidobacteriota bacterium]
AFSDANRFGARSGPQTDQACLDFGMQCAGPELRLPLKTAHGHAASLLGDASAPVVFLPHMIADERVPGLPNAKFCPYVEALPSLVRGALAARGLDVTRLVSPVVDLSVRDAANLDELTASISAVRPVTRARVARALGEARAARRLHQDQLLELGQAALRRARESEEPAIVVIGRPYNTLDPAISLDLPQFLASCGVEVIPMDCLPFRPELLADGFGNMFWHYGQRIVSALRLVAENESLHALYLTNFGCGPDSFLLSYAEAIMGRKPFLVLELDEHGSSGGYQTRIEAFLDVARAARRSPPRSAAVTASRRTEDADAWRRRTLWFPPMHPVGPRLVAAAIASNGVETRVLPPADDEAYAIGRRLMRGNECLPAPLTLGGFLKQMERERREGRDPGREAALFMPTACGPCRFGQYRTLQRQALDRAGLSSVPIVSPGSEDTYFAMKPVSLGWDAVLASDILFKMRCKVRPYERSAGDAEQVLERWVSRLERLVSSGRVAWADELGAAMDEFLRLPVRPVRKPLVGIVGEIYVRSDPYANGRVVEAVEALGGEAWLAPLAEWIEYTAWIEHFLARRRGRPPVERRGAVQAAMGDRARPPDVPAGRPDAARSRGARDRTGDRDGAAAAARGVRGRVGADGRTCRPVPGGRLPAGGQLRAVRLHARQHHLRDLRAAAGGAPHPGRQCVLRRGG